MSPPPAWSIVRIDASSAGVATPADARMRANTRGAIASKSTARAPSTRVAILVLTEEKEDGSSTERAFRSSAEAERISLLALSMSVAEGAGNTRTRPDFPTDTPEPPDVAPPAGIEAGSADGKCGSSSVALLRAAAARRAADAALQGSTQAVPKRVATARGRRRSARAQRSKRSRKRPSVPSRAHLTGNR